MRLVIININAEKITFRIKDFFSKCDQICRKLWIGSDLLKKSLTEDCILCALLSVIKSLKKCKQSI